MNCGDLYGRHLDCQWIDISDVPAGTYILRQTVNPDRLTAETDYKNNVVECTLTYHSGLNLELNEGSCKLSGECVPCSALIVHTRSIICMFLL